MYPDPKEIQNNLSGFLSFKNARIFTSELWKQLLNSIESKDVRKSENQKINIDKIKSFPRLGPSENKLASNEVFNQNKSYDKNEHRLNKLTGSQSYSFSSRYNSRSRSRSHDNYKYKEYPKYRYKSRSRTKSSSRYTPYTRYSRYTESYERSQSSHSSFKYDSRNKSYSSGSSSSNNNSEILSKPVSLKSLKDINDLYRSRNSQSSVPQSFTKTSPAKKERADDFKILMNNHDYFSEIEQNNSTDLSPSPVKRLSNTKSSGSSSSSSVSIAFVSPQNLQWHRRHSSSYTSSSDYSIEYMDQSLLLQQSRSYTSETDHESDIEWMTVEEYNKLMANELNTSNSSSSTSSNCSSYYSLNDIEWVEEYRFDQLSDDYLKI